MGRGKAEGDERRSNGARTVFEQGRRGVKGSLHNLGPCTIWLTAQSGSLHYAQAASNFGHNVARPCQLTPLVRCRHHGSQPCFALRHRRKAHGRRENPPAGLRGRSAGGPAWTQYASMGPTVNLLGPEIVLDQSSPTRARNVSSRSKRRGQHRSTRLRPCPWQS